MRQTKCERPYGIVGSTRGSEGELVGQEPAASACERHRGARWSTVSAAVVLYVLLPSDGDGYRRFEEPTSRLLRAWAETGGAHSLGRGPSSCFRSLQPAYGWN